MSSELLVNTRRQRWTLGVLLAVVGLALTALIPGGPVEHRHFGHIPPELLLTWQVALTALGLGSIWMAVLLVRGAPLNPGLMFTTALAYLVVYALDLIGWFPPTPTPMSRVLLTLEMLGIALVIPVFWLTAQSAERITRLPLALLFHPLAVAAIVVAAVGLLIFAGLAPTGN